MIHVIASDIQSHCTVRRKACRAIGNQKELQERAKVER